MNRLTGLMLLGKDRIFNKSAPGNFLSSRALLQKYRILNRSLFVYIYESLTLIIRDVDLSMRCLAQSKIIAIKSII